MRNILIDHGRKHCAQRRTGGLTRVPLFDFEIRNGRHTDQMLVLEQALDRLGDLDRRLLTIVELRYFSGHTVSETAKILGVTEATVEVDWKFCKSWLYLELTKGAPVRF